MQPPPETDESDSRTVTAYLYPWDLEEDNENVSRLETAGFEHVAVAAAYHSVRAATPRDRRRRYLVAETAALYRPVRAEFWRGQGLVPREASWAASRDSFGQAVRRLAVHGLRTKAWIVLTHNSTLAGSRPDLAVRNCFGDIYRYALCPAHAEVRQYAALLAAEAVADLDLEGVSLEAWGQLGAAHASHHDKTAAAYSTGAAEILSVCCCDGCRRSWAARGLSGAETEAGLRLAFGEAQNSSGAGSVLRDGELGVALLATRHSHCDALLEETVDALKAVSPSLPVAVHAQADPWAAGASPGLTARTTALVDEVVVPWPFTSLEGTESLGAAKAAAGRSVPVAAYVNLLEAKVGMDIDDCLGRLLTARADGLHLYHFGLANDRQLELFARIRSAYRQSPS